MYGINHMKKLLTSKGEPSQVMLAGNKPSQVAQFECATLIDACGEEFTFPIEFVDTPARLLHHLIKRFELRGVSKQGLEWVQDQRLTIQALIDGRKEIVDIHAPRAW